jgi:hypothetical protein
LSAVDELKNYPAGNTFSDTDLQEFTDQGITDPVLLAECGKKLRRPRKPSPWMPRLLIAAALVAAFVLGYLVGR